MVICLPRDFPNRSKGWGKFSRNPPSGWESEILLGRGDFFYRAVGTREVIFTISTFFKAKNSFLSILNIKIKIRMTSRSKEYENKTKMVYT